MFSSPFNTFNSNTRNITNNPAVNADNTRLFAVSSNFGNSPPFGTNTFGANSQQNKFGYGLQTTRNPSANIFESNASNKITCSSFENSSIFPSNNDPNKNQTVFAPGYANSFGTGVNQGIGFRIEQCHGSIHKFNPNLINESVMRHGNLTEIKARMQNLGGMQEYQNYCFEELRNADYVVNRKGAQPGSSILRTAPKFPPTNSMFGGTTFPNSTSTYANCFNGTSNKSNTFTSTMPLNENHRNSNLTNSFFGPSTSTPTPSFDRTVLGTGASSYMFSSSAPCTNLSFGEKSPFTPKVQNFTNSTNFTNTFPRHDNSNSGFSFTTPPNISQKTQLFGSNDKTSSVIYPSCTITPSAATNNASTFSANNFNMGKTQQPQNNLFCFSARNTLPTPASNINSPNLTSAGTYTFQRPQLVNGLPTPSLPATQPLQSKSFMPPNIIQVPASPVQLQTPSSVPHFMLQSMPPLQSVTFPTQTSGIHSYIIDLTQQFPTPPLLKNLTPVYNSGRIYSGAINPRSAEKTNDKYNITPINSVPKTLRIRPKTPTVEKTLFDGLDEETSIEVNLSIKKKCPRRLFIPKFHPISSENNLDEFSEILKQDDEDSNVTELEKIVTNLHNARPTTLPEKRKDTILSKLYCLCRKPKIVDSGEGFPKLTDSDKQILEDIKTKDASVITDQEEHDQIERKEALAVFEHPTGIVNTRYGYYTIPNFDDLLNYVDPDTGSCIVTGFTIGRKGYGNIFFPETFDVFGINIDDNVHFRHKEVIVFPDDENKPPIGEHLNRRAQITLDRVWPTDKTTKCTINDPAVLEQLQYERVLRRMCHNHQTEFVEYRAETGSWVFNVSHF